MTLLESALEYIKDGFSIFPVNLNKKPLTSHGLKDATKTILGVREYWGKYPNAGIGLCTDGLLVLDFDMKSGGLKSKEIIETQYGLPQTRIHQTGGGGFHYLYRNTDGRNIRNATKLGGYEGVDLRANGGYIVVPPSPHPSGQNYTVYDYSPIANSPGWLMEMATVKPIESNSQLEGEPIKEGERNSTLTKMAGAMRRQGMTVDEIETALLLANKRCQPELPEKEIQTIAKSVSRYKPVEDGYISNNSNNNINNSIYIGGNEKTGEILDFDSKTNDTPVSKRIIAYPSVSSVSNASSVSNVSEDILRTYISESSGQWIDYRDLDNDLGIRTPEQKAYRRVVIGRLVKDKFIERHPSISTKIRLPNKNLQEMVLDFDSSLDYLPLKWVFGIEEKVDVYRKSLSIIAGTKDAGKTALLLNFARDNCELMQIHYFNSEMGNVELMKRLRNFENYKDWVSKVHWVERSSAFDAVIFPDDINLIDFLEINEEFWLIGSFLSSIYEKLNKGIAIIAIQKDPRSQYGRGGTFGTEKARLYVTLNHQSGINTATIEIGKMWHDEMDNPRGQYVNYKLIKGCIFTNITNWKQPQYKGYGV